MARVTKLCFLFTGLMLLSWNLWGQSGSSCNDPLVAVVGTNHADNSNGDQWFVFTPTQNKKIVISTCGLTSEFTYLDVYRGNCEGTLIGSSMWACSSAQSELSFYGDSGQSYYICWRKYSTNDSYDWVISEQDFSPGEFCANAIVAQADTNHVDNSKGDQWFVYTSLQANKVTLSTCDMTTENTFVEVYRGDCNNMELIGFNDDSSCGEQAEVSFPADSGKTYYIVWRNYRTSGSYDWIIRKQEYIAGEFCANAIVAQADTNHVDNSKGDQWFVYTPAGNKQVIISTCGLTEENTYVDIYKGTCNGMYKLGISSWACGGQSDYSFVAESGQTYYIVWRANYTNGSYDWVLNEFETIPGEFCESAIVGQPDTNHVNHTLSKQWFVYTSKGNRKVIISTCGLTDEITEMTVYRGDCLWSQKIGSSFGPCLFDEAEMTFFAEPGQSYYIEWRNDFTSDNYDWLLKEFEVMPGDFCWNALPVNLGINYAATSRGSQWFSYKPSKNSWYTLKTCLSDSNEVRLYVYSGNCYGLTQVVYFQSCMNNNDSVMLLSSNTYYFRFKEKSFRDFYWSLEKISTSVETSAISETLRIFPNPVTEQLTIELVNSKSPASYVLYGVDGKQVAKGQLVGSVTLSTKQLKAGMYTLRVVQDGNVEVRKVLKQ